MSGITRLCIFFSAHLFTGEAAAVVAPSGRTEEIEPFFFPGDICAADIFFDAAPFMEYNRDGRFLLAMEM